MNDTIAAIATALANKAISIIRVSGPEAIDIVNKIFVGKDLRKVPSHTIHYGKIKIDNRIDEVLVSAPPCTKNIYKRGCCRGELSWRNICY